MIFVRISSVSNNKNQSQPKGVWVLTQLIPILCKRMDSIKKINNFFTYLYGRKKLNDINFKITR
jgi:hypothetical protein